MTTQTQAELQEFLDDVELTDDIDEAIFIMNDGTMISGEFDCGIRGTDHNELLSYFDNMDWEQLHKELHIVRLVPETHFALINKGQQLNEVQQDLLNDSDYTIAEY